MKTYSVDEVFEKLRLLKITSNEESIRRWLRTGKLVGYKNSKKEGWRVHENDLQQFIDERMPEFNTTFDASDEIVNNKTIVVDEAAVREKMWFEIVRRNIFEGYVEIKKSRLKECIEHKSMSNEFFNYCWEQLNQNKLSRSVPRVPYLLDSFLYDTKRIKMDSDFEMLEEKVIFALIEYLRLKRINL